MTLLNEADKIYYGALAADAVYAGATKVWPQAGGGAWTPADLGSALRLWIKADTGISATGGLINQANDQSGNNFHLVSADPRRPTLNATGYNGKPCIELRREPGTYLCSGGVIGATAVGKAFALGSTSSWFFIGDFDHDTAGYGRFLSYLAAGAERDYDNAASICGILRDSSNAAIGTYWNGAPATIAAAAVAGATRTRVLIVLDGTNARTYINNVLLGGPAALPAVLGSPGMLSIGGDLGLSGGTITTPGSGWTGKAAEILVTNTALDATTRDKLDAYVVARLGA